MATNPWSLPKGLTSAERKAVKAIFEALKAQKRTLSPEAMNALKFGNIDQFLNFVEWETLGQFGELQNILADMARKAGMEVFSPMGGINADLAFDLIDQRAVQWAEREGAKLVRQVSEELRETVRQTVADSTAGNLTVDGLARRIRTNLPLTARDARAVDNFRQRNFENYLAEGMSESRAREQADSKAERYSDKMISRRAKTIARTETAFAAMEGRYMGWEAGVQEGLIDPLSKKEWIAEPDACDICAPLDGMVVGWNKEFPSGYKMAPAHPNCRCSVVIVPPDFTDTPYTEQAEAEYEPNAEERFNAKRYSDFDDPELSVTQQMAVSNYQGGGSGLINQAVGSPNEIDPNTGRMRMFSPYYDEGMEIKSAMTPLEQDTKLIRAVSADNLGLQFQTDYTGEWNQVKTPSGTARNYKIQLNEGVAESLVGKTYDFTWLSSTSAAGDGTQFHEFTEIIPDGVLVPPPNFARNYPVWLELNAPKGIKALKVPNSSEREVILDSMRTIVTGQRVENGKLIVEMLITENL